MFAIPCCIVRAQKYRICDTTYAPVNTIDGLVGGFSASSSLSGGAGRGGGLRPIRAYDSRPKSAPIRPPPAAAPSLPCQYGRAIWASLPTVSEHIPSSANFQRLGISRRRKRRKYRRYRRGAGSPVRRNRTRRDRFGRKAREAGRRPSAPVGGAEARNRCMSTRRAQRRA